MANKKNKQMKGKGAKKDQAKGFPLMTVLVTALVVAVGVGAGVLIWALTQGGSSGDSGEIQLSDASLPSWINHPDAPRNVEKGYRIALTIPEDLEQIPCYCGCGQSANHKSNLDCFIKSRNGDNVVFDDHAAYWDLWVDTALDVFQWKQEGKSIKEIREMIEEKYGSDYGQGTPTPPVE